MAVILENVPVAPLVYRMRLSGVSGGEAGQFYMLRAPGFDPLLGRPISLFDADAHSGEAAFVYQCVGRGTRLFSSLAPGQTLEANGPCGSGFPLLAGDAVVIGGGIGAAPLHLLCKALRAADQSRRVALYLGFREATFLTDAFRAVCDDLHVDVGGYVTDAVDFGQNATYYACGPAPMLRAAGQKAADAGARLYVSLEKRMACGVGACLGCTIKTASGNRRVCRDGPVFPYGEVRDVL